MYKALKFPQSGFKAHRPAAVCTVLLSSMVLAALPATADQLRMDHQNVTVEPIETLDESPQAEQGAFEPLFEDETPALNAEPVIHEPKAAPEFATEVIPETAVDHGPEVDPQPAAKPADEPFFPAQIGRPEAEVATEEVPEPVAIDPLMEAAEAHEENKAEEIVENEPEAPAEQAPVETAAPANSKQPKKAVEVAAVSPDDKTDIFDQWAHSKFEAQKEKAPHPLAAEHPDDFVVVCEAGCAVNPVEIVYIERRDARGPVNEKPLKAGMVAGTSSIDCVGGCYGGRNSYGAIAATWDPSAIVDEREWITTVKKAKEKSADKKDADSSSRWYERIN